MEDHPEDYMTHAEREKFLKENKLGCKDQLTVIIGGFIFLIVLFLFFFLAEKLGF